MNGIREKIFFLSFSVYLILFWLKIMLERGFLIFSIFLLFFSEFSSPGRVWTEFGTNFFFSLFLGLSLLGLTQTVLDRNNTGINFFNLLNLFWNFLARVEHEQNSGLKFFSLFLGLSHPVLAKNINGKSFFNFLNFLSIFLGIFLPGSSMNGIGD